MNRFKNILVVVDDPTTSYAALARGVQLARRSGARLTAVHAFEGPEYGVLTALEGVSARELEQFECESRKTELDQLVSGLRTRGVEIGTKLLVGKPFIEIVREVIRSGHDLVLKDAPRRGELGGGFFTGLDMHLMRKCPCPLWMVKLSGRTRHRRIIAAVNPDVGDVEHSSLNGKIMNLAAALARLDSAELHVVHAWQLYGEALLHSPRLRLSPAQVDAMIENNRARVSERLEQLVHEHKPADIVPQVHLIKGDAARSLLHAVSELHADLLVMGTVSRVGIAGLIIGNTAETVLNRVNCSVLAIKPDGFVTPVRLPAPEAPQEAATHLYDLPRLIPVVAAT